MNILFFLYIISCFFGFLNSKKLKPKNDFKHECENLRFDGKGVREFLKVPDGIFNCETNERIESKFERLPLFAKPIHYKILLKPSLKTFDFDGEETITIIVEEKTNYIKLHSHRLDIKSISCKASNGQEYKSLSFKYNKELEMIKILLPRIFNKETVDLKLTYYGKLTDNMIGFYKSSYKDSKGNTKYLASTQFESTYARQAFPCFDEPTFKATFEISLQVDKTLTALSNGELKNVDQTDDGSKIYNFKSSMYMSSYLVAFIIGEFDYVQAYLPGNNQTRIRVYTLPGKTNQAQYALETGVKSIQFFNKWFNFSYPLPKMDMLAVPDFAFGAMENTGILTFRENALLMDSDKSSINQKTYMATIISHEIIHQWFGNIVTMEWWDQLWLKEGFASFLEYVGIDDYYKDLNIWKAFENEEILPAFSLDSLRSSHPMEVPINNPSELEDIYDDITYRKSSSIIRMLYNYLGKDTFKKALQIYIKNNAYKNTIPTDLWKALAEASGKNITEMMATWTKQMGYPVVSVSEEIDGTSRKLHFKQRRYLADGSDSKGEIPWHIPITIKVISKNNITQKYKRIMKQYEESFTFESIHSLDTLIINPGTVGFYRVQYSKHMLHKIFSEITKNKISPENLFSIANDVYALVRVGKLDVSYFIKLLEITKDEENYDLHSIISKGISSCHHILEKMNNTESIKKFNKFIVKTFLPLFEKIGWDAIKSEKQDITKLRPLLIKLLAMAKHQETIYMARYIFDEHYKNNSHIDPNLRSVIFSIIGEEDGIKGNDKLKDIYEKSTFPEEAIDSLIAMGKINNIQRLKELFEYAFVENKVRKQNLLFFFYGALSTDTGKDYAYDYFIKNMDLLLEKFGGVNTSTFQKFLNSVSLANPSKDKANEIETFFKCNLDCKTQGTIDRTLKQTTERMRNINLKRKIIGPSLVKYMKKQDL